MGYKIKILINYSILLSLIVIYSCKNNNKKDIVITGKNNHYIKQKYNDKGILVFEKECIKTDTGLIGDGFVKFYYEDGKLKSIVHEINDEYDGVYYGYDKNSTIIQIRHFLHGALAGSQIFYENGLIKQYVFVFPRTEFDSLDNSHYFIVNYGSEGKIDSVENSPIYLVKIKNGDTPFQIYFASPPQIVSKYSCELFLGLKERKKSIVIELNDSNLGYINNDIKFFNSSANGSAKCIYHAILYDSISHQLIKKFSISLPLQKLQ